MRDGRLATRISRRGALLVAAAACLLAACGLDWSFQPGNGADGGSSGASSGSGSSGSSGSSGAGDGGDGSAPAGPTCRTNADCPLGAFCHFPDHLCGKAMLGRCQAPRTGCTSSSDPVCACDNLTNDNECAANGRGQDTSIDANCMLQAGTYRCGDVYCLNAQPAFQEFCIRHGGDVTPTYSCELTSSFGCVEDWCSDAGCAFGACACSTIPGGARLDCP
jgi:hypothetical protein